MPDQSAVSISPVNSVPDDADVSTKTPVAAYPDAVEQRHVESATPLSTMLGERGSANKRNAVE